MLAATSLALLMPAAVSGAAAEVRTFPVGQPGLVGIASGPDGNLWVTQARDANRIGRITLSGVPTWLPGAGIRPDQITAGADGNLWYTESGWNKIGRITPGGLSAHFSLPSTSGSVPQPQGIAAGADGNVWFVEHNADKVGRITPAGAIVDFPISTGWQAGPTGIAPGADGNVWFTEQLGDRIGRITPAGTITEFPLAKLHSEPLEIAPGPDGNLWFTEIVASRIGRITPAGTITEFPIPTADAGPRDIVAGPDGNLWFTEFGVGKLGRITPGGAVTEYTLPTSTPLEIELGPDGNLWLTASGYQSASLLMRVKTAAPLTSYVLSQDTGFVPASRMTSQGHDVQWTFRGPGVHGVADDSGMGLFASGPRPVVSSFSHRFTAAGTYPYRDPFVPALSGKIAIPVSASPATGTPATTFAVGWSSAAATAPFVFDVQLAYCASTPCTPVYGAWRTGTTSAGDSFGSTDPAWQGAGTYSFRSRLRKATDGTRSGWSGVKSTVVH